MNSFDIHSTPRMATSGFEGVPGIGGGGYGTYVPTYTPSSATPVYAQPEQAAGNTPSVSAQTMSGYTVQYQPAVINSYVNDAIAQKIPLNDLMVPVGGIFDSQNNAVSAMDLPVDENGMVRLDDLVRTSPEVGSSIAATLPNTADSINAMLSRPAQAAPAAGLAAPYQPEIQVGPESPRELRMRQQMGLTNPQALQQVGEGTQRSLSNLYPTTAPVSTTDVSSQPQVPRLEFSRDFPKALKTWLGVALPLGDGDQRSLSNLYPTTAPISTTGVSSQPQVPGPESPRELRMRQQMGLTNPQALQQVGEGVQRSLSNLYPTTAPVSTTNVTVPAGTVSSEQRVSELVGPPAPTTTGVPVTGTIATKATDRTIGEPPSVVTPAGTLTQEQLSRQGFVAPRKPDGSTMADYNALRDGTPTPEAPMAATPAVTQETVAKVPVTKTPAQQTNERVDTLAAKFGINTSGSIREFQDSLNNARLLTLANKNTTPADMEAMDELNTLSSAYINNRKTAYVQDATFQTTRLKDEITKVTNDATMRPQEKKMVLNDLNNRLTQVTSLSKDPNIDQNSINKITADVDEGLNYNQRFAGTIVQRGFFKDREFGSEDGPWNGGNVMAAVSGGLSLLGIIAGVVQQQQQYKAGLKAAQDEREFRERMLMLQLGARGGGGGGGGGGKPPSRGGKSGGPDPSVRL